MDKTLYWFEFWLDWLGSNRRVAKTVLRWHPKSRSKCERLALAALIALGED